MINRVGQSIIPRAQHYMRANHGFIKTSLCAQKRFLNNDPIEMEIKELKLKVAKLTQTSDQIEQSLDAQKNRIDAIVKGMLLGSVITWGLFLSTMT